MKEVVKEAQLRHFQGYFFYPPLMVLAIALAIATGIAWQRLLAAYVLGLVAWMFIEYGMHRILFHAEVRGQLWRFLPWVHQKHHEEPRDVDLIISPIWFSLPFTLLFILILWALIRNLHLALTVQSGIVSGYLWYEFVHYSAHCRQPRTRLMRYLKNYHLLHHHTKDTIWFGVTSPAIDLLFGSYKRFAPQRDRE